MARVYKHCVVGHGLTGTAACKYLAEHDDNVVLVGPSEASGAHGACYDEGRIYRILDPKQSWATLAERSISRYAAITEASDVEFFSESGLLIFGTEDDFIKSTKEVAAKMGTPLKQLTPAEIATRYPWLGIPHSTQLGLLQTENAGHMSPRKLTEAQLKLARGHGAEYFDKVVQRIAQPTDDGHFVIDSEDGTQILAENVLVAAGVYTSLLPILPEAVVIALTGAQALLVEISEESAASLSGMPSMIYEGETEDDCYYLLPPIKYPDDSWLIKIGPSTAYAPPLKTAAEVDAWFRGGLDPVFESKAQQVFHGLFPGVAVVAWKSLLCVTDHTPTQNAYIDTLAPRWGICTGGNGWAAKSSDEIGYLAAQMMALPSHWAPDPELPRAWFRAVTPSALLPTPQLSTALAQVEACEHVMLGKASEALSALTELLAERPCLRARRKILAIELQAKLVARWGAQPSVLCASEVGCAPGHPYILMSADSVRVIVLMP